MFRLLKSRWTQHKHALFQLFFQTRLRFQYPDMTIYTSQRNMLRLFNSLSENGQFSVIETNVNMTSPVQGKKGFDRLLRAKNAGGSSMYSEALSIEVLSRLLGAQLYKTEMELEYRYPNVSGNGGSGPLMDYACLYRGGNDQIMTVGVSVTRAMAYHRAYTKEDASVLVSKKLRNMMHSNQNIVNTQFDRRILHVWTESGKNASLIRRQCKKFNHKNTIVLISIVNTNLVFFNNQHLDGRMSCKEPRRVIGVDLDQTLAHTHESLAQWHNDMYGTDFTVTDFNSLDYWKIWGGTQEESCMKIRDFYDSVHFEQIEPIRDFALEALKMLKRRNFSLVIITSRQQFVAEKTKRFVDRHYPGIFESIYFCNLNLSATEQLEYISKPKSVICQEIGVDVLIDDCLEHAFDCSNLGIDILLYDHKGKYSWNHEDRVEKKSQCPPTLTSSSKRLYQQHTPNGISKNIHRMMNWRDIIAQFPKPTSPLRYCYFPDSFTEEEDSVEEDDDEVFDSPNCRYETVEVEMSDDEDWNNWV